MAANDVFSSVAFQMHDCKDTMNDQRFLPLVSPRSPSYARALSEIDDKETTTEAISVAGLNRLVETENDARRVCEYIASSTQDSALGDLALRLAGIHTERQLLVGDLVRGLGGSPPMPDESRAVLRFGRSYFDGLTFPSEVMPSLHKMYAEIRAEYLRQATELDLPVGIRHALQDLCPAGNSISPEAS